jgi:hypothetical protein
MDTLFPFLVGATGKIYDDIEDQKLQINPIISESLKSINILFFTLTAKNDFMFSLSTFLLALIGAGIDNNFWKSFIVITFILLFISYSSFTSTNWRFFILIVILILLFTHIEERAFPEEYSVKKLISRFLGFIFFSMIYFIPSSFYIQKIFGNDFYLETGNITYFNKLILVCLGGTIVSVLSQINSLLKSNPI